MNFSYYTVPMGSTAILATFTYPFFVKIARSKRLLGLRNFYAIHIAIAPFMAFVNLNFFGFLQTIFQMKIKE